MKQVFPMIFLFLTCVSWADVTDPGNQPVGMPVIIDRPIRFDAARVKLTLAYRRAHQDKAASDTTITPRVIVLHYTGGRSFQSAWAYFNNLQVEASRKGLAQAGAVNVSAHFVVDRDGTIYRLLPETMMARHVIGLNHVAIGVENVGDGKKYPLTDAQIAADAALVRYLAARHPITHLLGHYEAKRMRSHAYYVEKDPAYRDDHDDPGERFMTSVRAKLGDLALQGPSAKP
jgi:N-acetylmuramoyl-L-alanine amidase